MKIQGQFREVKVTHKNANNEFVDCYYMIPEHDDAEENDLQLDKKLLSITMSLRSGEE